MSINDPIGDLITRIRNAQMRRHNKTSVPASKLRGWVLDVLQDEGYIRGYARVEQDGRKPAFRNRAEILRGRARHHARSSACPSLDAGFTSSVDRLAVGAQRSGHFDCFNAQGRHVRCCGARRECRRRSPLRSLLRTFRSLIANVPYWQKIRYEVPSRALRSRLTARLVKAKGPKGELEFVVNELCTVALEEGSVDGNAG